MSLRVFPVGIQLKHRCAVFMRALSAGYKTNRGRDASLEIYNERAEPRGRVERTKFIQQAEEMEDRFNIENPDFVNDAHGEELRRRKRVKMKIIERKYFKKPQEQNLLTWDAKEQMRYLHQEFPDEWTVDRLADSFPVSRDGALKILHSSWQPKSLSEVLRHDKRVQKNWLALKSSTKEDGGPIELRYRKLIENGTLVLAAGNPSLPSPTIARQFLTDSKPQPLDTIAALLPLDDGLSPRRNHKSISSIGPIASLVEDYCKQKEGEKAAKGLENVEENRLEYTKHQGENEKMLQQIINEGAPLLISGSYQKPAQRDLLGTADGVERGLVAKGKGGRDTPSVDRSLFDQMQKLSKSEAEAILRGEDVIPENEEKDQSSYTHQPVERKSLRMRPVSAQVGMLNMHMNELQMKGTRKIPGDRQLDSDYSDGSEEDWQLSKRRVEKYYHDEERERILNHIQYDVPRGVTYGGRQSESQGEEAYLYTEQTGYQYPFGRIDHEATIKVPKRGSGNRQPKMYQKGRSFYDEDGELLYRIP